MIYYIHNKNNMIFTYEIPHIVHHYYKYTT